MCDISRDARGGEQPAPERQTRERPAPPKAQAAPAPGGAPTVAAPRAAPDFKGQWALLRYL